MRKFLELIYSLKFLHYVKLVFDVISFLTIAFTVFSGNIKDYGVFTWILICLLGGIYLLLAFVFDLWGPKNYINTIKEFAESTRLKLEIYKKNYGNSYEWCIKENEYEAWDEGKHEHHKQIQVYKYIIYLRKNNFTEPEISYLKSIGLLNDSETEFVFKPFVRNNIWVIAPKV